MSQSMRLASGLLFLLGWGIAHGQQEASITVTSPAGGEEALRSTSSTITRTSSDIKGNVVTELMQDGSPVGVVVSAVPVESGQHARTGGRLENGTTVSGTGFKVRVTAANASFISQYGITWTFDREYECGQFANGDYWVVGPVTIVSIVNSHHVYGFTPVQGQDGSMINPGTDDRQGYDHSLSSYDASLNVSHPNGQPISAGNPLVLGASQTLVSAVSWLYRSETDTEPGCPTPFNGTTHTPRPVLRTAAVLTCLAAPPPDGSFRPPYAGADKTVQFNVGQLSPTLLRNLSPAGISGIPDVALMENGFQRVWLDHVNDYLGSYFHPSENMDDYGREIAKKIGDAALLLNLDFSQLPGSPGKEKLLMELVQLGIDLVGIADNGGFWRPNGGFNQGRKWPILFAGLMLDDDHMMGVGNWTTLFQEDGNTFYVTQDDVDRTHSPLWHPDSRNDSQPYEVPDIGLPEWGIRHATDPYADDKGWNAVYRATTTCSYPGFVLAAHIMGQKQAWNHDPLFDFVDRWMEITDGYQQQQSTTVFSKSMWHAYRASYPPVWTRAVSGTVTLDGSPLAGVTLSGLPGNPVSDGSGAYTAPIADNWGGTVTPVLAGYTFLPASRTYAGIIASQPAQDFAAAVVGPFTLAVSRAGNGTGTVTSIPAGIDCGAMCEASFPIDTVVTLTAAAGGVSTFTSWSGEGCSGTGTCQVTMSQARHVTATFADGTPNGDVNADGWVNVQDVFYLINHIFAGGPAPIGPANANGDAGVDVQDVFYLINYLLAGGPGPV